MTSSVSHIDWCVKSENLIVNSDNMELKYLNVDKAKDITSAGARDVEWHKYTHIYSYYT